MENLGINTALLLVQLTPIIMVIGLAIISLVDLRKKQLSGTTLGIWVLIICAVPIIGSLAYWIIKPSAETR
ncbi:MAG: PLDc N-terminal domain-containing protein [Chloroflexi bacterium]|nr:PLDc N-terminal domain-containing protein [Chloroflexota bacterium]